MHSGSHRCGDLRSAFEESPRSGVQVGIPSTGRSMPAAEPGSPHGDRPGHRAQHVKSTRRLRLRSIVTRGNRRISSHSSPGRNRRRREADHVPRHRRGTPKRPLPSSKNAFVGREPRGPVRPRARACSTGTQGPATMATVVNPARTHGRPGRRRFARSTRRHPLQQRRLLDGPAPSRASHGRRSPPAAIFGGAHVDRCWSHEHQSRSRSSFPGRLDWSDQQPRHAPTGSTARDRELRQRRGTPAGKARLVRPSWAVSASQPPRSRTTLQPWLDQTWKLGEFEALD